ncbi:aminotransferase class I/II-fold pyridoxal phosphate-dependent enzyme [Hyunsoonleella pacifica]|uniref:Pyridoxal phosphate-dependent aminotransferase family protein n=1 Tax=Hyunsoonleella pacifica TaxID=1080224 RepID=A0A4Q9FP72_9FLAO|nr:pyridoxal phosphate-dependent aminotransferase family protein [Hyunsoonleella pacifica]TBN16499.1 pyridoxal phosphate-dependent aminotransferase family protein [Hyunsoonleella pacifica]GGD18871.1 8-amino-7-oxononanoate synthase [Hyunsoonleella pacifica]
MKGLPKKLNQKLEARKANNALRKLGVQDGLVDFSSNDYLGFSKNETIFDDAHKFLIENNIKQNGATGSRLLSGNHKLYDKVEQQLCIFHNSPSAIIFNSGYDANIGFFSSVPQRGDIIFYDEYIHASIRDGITMSYAKAYKFKHNDLNDLEKRCQTEYNRSPKGTNIYIVTESVFSMDGDTPDLVTLAQLSKKHKAYLIIDEAHAVGVFEKQGEGLVQNSNIEHAIFARITTFGKGMGCHGAAILGSEKLKQYLINFSRSFIYTTALPPHSLATIYTAYNALQNTKNITKLHKNINHFKAEIKRNKLETIFIASHSAIHCCIVSGTTKVKSIAEQFKNNGFDVKPILSPTVPEGQERLRFCLHSYNSQDEISKVLQLLATFVML